MCLNGKGPMERAESIDMLRFVEHSVQLNVTMQIQDYWS